MISRQIRISIALIVLLAQTIAAQQSQTASSQDEAVIVAQTSVCDLAGTLPRCSNKWTGRAGDQANTTI